MDKYGGESRSGQFSIYRLVRPFCDIRAPVALLTVSIGDIGVYLLSLLPIESLLRKVPGCEVVYSRRVLIKGLSSFSISHLAYEEDLVRALTLARMHALQ